MKKAVSILVLFLCFMCFPLKAEGKTLEIYTAHDLVKLAKECHYDAYSKDLRVELMSDISLRDVKDFSLMVFDGVFDGNGHTISDYIVDGRFSPCGFVGHLMDNGRIENLHIEGVSVPGGDGNNAGIFAGINDGVIEDCSFKGTTKANENTGMAAGINNGVIKSFVAEGIIRGEKAAGGIAGKNSGVIDSCISYVSLNTQSTNSSINISNIEFSSLDDLKQVSSFLDAGGIAGINSGEIISCRNYGTVGYQHVGYNIGGIAGRSNGYIVDCENDGTVDGRKDVGGIAGHMEPDIINDISSSAVGRLKSQMNQLNYLVNRASDSFSAGNDYATEIMDEMSDEALRAIDALKNIDIEISRPDDGDIRDIEVNADLSALDDSLRSLNDSFGKLSGSIGDTAGNLSDDIKQISDKLNQISATAMELINYEPSNPYKDMSSVNIENIRYGRVRNCLNSGEISGDMNVGGIAGVMSVEKDNDPENDDLFSFDIDKSNSYELKDLLDSCDNTGAVKAKRSNSGGIVGYQAVGYVYNNRNRGDVSSNDGNYVGGIAGRSSAKLSDNLARCYLEGNKYIGGIAGYIDEDGSLMNSYSMVNIGSYEQYAGAICGLSDGTLKDNCYYSLNLYGVNGISYSGQCVPLEYSEIVRRDEFFDKLYLSFEYDEKTVKCVELEYGDSLDDSVYPKMLGNKDTRVVFNEADLKNIRQDMHIKGVDEEYVKALSYSLRSDGEVLLYCDGQFSKDDRLRLSVLKSDEENLLNAYHIDIPDDGNGIHNLRLRIDDNVVFKVDGNVTDYELIGSFASFNVAGLSHDIMIYGKAESYVPYYVMAFVAGGLIVLSLVIRHHRKKEKLNA